MNLAVLFIYVFIIFFNWISIYVPYLNYVDEVICLISFVYLIMHIFNGGKIHVTRSQRDSYFCIILILLIGLFGNVFYSYMSSVSVILRDIVGTFKFFIIYLAGRKFIDKYNVLVKPKKLMFTTKIIITVIFFFCLLNLFVNTGMADEVRYGIRSYRFIYTHYTYLVYSEVILFSMLFMEEKKNLVFKGMSLVSMAATLRTKAFIAIAFILAYYLLSYLKKKNVSFKDFMKPIYIVPVVVIGYCISKSKIQEYLSWGVSQSIRVGVHSVGFKIANKHFPFGTGLGTYGTNISYANDSKLYSIYNSINYSHLLEYGYATMSDVYWPSIYVQFGYIGCILFLLLIICICKDLLVKAICDKKSQFSALLVLFYMVSASVSEATFSNESGAFSAVILLIIIAVSKYKVKYKAKVATTKQKE